MKYRETKLDGAFIIEPDIFEDERGFFARIWSMEEFAGQGLNSNFVQCNISSNKRQGTLRGMHFQAFPHQEAKLIRCTAGAIYDVIIDLRDESATWGSWVGIELTSINHLMLYVPEGFAHGFQTLEDDTEISYQISEYYCADSAQGVRWDDPAFGINWPLDVTVISNRDRSHPLVDLRGAPPKRVRPKLA